MTLEEIEVGTTYVVVTHRSCRWLNGERVTVERIEPAARYPIVAGRYAFAPAELSPVGPEGE